MDSSRTLFGKSHGATADPLNNIRSLMDPRSLCVARKQTTNSNLNSESGVPSECLQGLSQGIMTISKKLFAVLLFLGFLFGLSCGAGATLGVMWVAQAVLVSSPLDQQVSPSQIFGAESFLEKARAHVTEIGGEDSGATKLLAELRKVMEGIQPDNIAKQFESANAALRREFDEKLEYQKLLISEMHSEGKAEIARVRNRFGDSLLLKGLPNIIREQMTTNLPRIVKGEIAVQLEPVRKDVGDIIREQMTTNLPRIVKGEIAVQLEPVRKDVASAECQLQHKYNLLCRFLDRLEEDMRSVKERCATLEKSTEKAQQDATLACSAMAAIKDSLAEVCPAVTAKLFLEAKERELQHQTSTSDGMVMADCAPLKFDCRDICDHWDSARAAGSAPSVHDCECAKD